MRSWYVNRPRLFCTWYKYRNGTACIKFRTSTAFFQVQNKHRCLFQTWNTSEQHRCLNWTSCLEDKNQVQNKHRSSSFTHRSLSSLKKAPVRVPYLIEFSVKYSSNTGGLTKFDAAIKFRTSTAFFQVLNKHRSSSEQRFTGHKIKFFLIFIIFFHGTWIPVLWVFFLGVGVGGMFCEEWKKAERIRLSVLYCTNTYTCTQATWVFMWLREFGNLTGVFGPRKSTQVVASRCKSNASPELA